MRWAAIFTGNGRQNNKFSSSKKLKRYRYFCMVLMSSCKMEKSCGQKLRRMRKLVSQASPLYLWAGLRDYEKIAIDSEWPKQHLPSMIWLCTVYHAQAKSFKHNAEHNMFTDDNHHTLISYLGLGTIASGGM